MEIGWKMCGITGGAPYSGIFCVTSVSDDDTESDESSNPYYYGDSSHSFAVQQFGRRLRGSKTRLEDSGCSFICSSGSGIFSIDMYDRYGDGWGGGYYSIRSSSGEELFGGTLVDGEEESHQICLKASQCYYSMMDYFGNTPDEITYTICGITLQYTDIAKICVDSTAQSCTVELLNQPPPGLSCSGTALTVTMLDIAAIGWPLSSYTISRVDNPNFVISTDGDSNFGFIKADSMCLNDGCYNFNVIGPSSQTEIWSIADVRGPIPYDSEVCFESTYRLNRCDVHKCTRITSYSIFILVIDY